MNNEYKKTFSAIYPSDEAVERSIRITENEKNKKGKILPSLIAVAACFALIVTGVAANAVKAPDNKITPSNTTSTASSNTSSISKEAPGFALVAYAGEKEVDKWGIKTNTPTKSKIGAIDIRGKSQKEIDAIVEKLYDDYKLVDWDFPSYESDDKNVLTLLDTNIKAYKNAVIYQFRNGFFTLDLDNDTAESVREIRVENNNSDASVVITSLSIYYDENGELKDEYEMYTKGIHKDVLSGEEYRRDLALEEKHGERMFGISWNIETPLVEKLNDNPNYDLSQISDTITIEVELKTMQYQKA